MHRVVNPKVFYFGTPVVLVSTTNPDGSPNLAPMSSAWWLGRSCMLGLGARSQTTENLRRGSDLVLNLVDPSLVEAVDRLALLTGSPTLTPGKRDKGYRVEPDKFGAARLTPIPSDLVAAPRVAESPIQLEAVVRQLHDFGESRSARAIEVEVVRSHIREDLLVEGHDDHVDPIKWDPLIMKFTEFFGGGSNVYPSRLASGWDMRHETTGTFVSR